MRCIAVLIITADMTAVASLGSRSDWSVAVWSPVVEGMDCATKYGIWYPCKWSRPDPFPFGPVLIVHT